MTAPQSDLTPEHPVIDLVIEGASAEQLREVVRVLREQKFDLERRLRAQGREATEEMIAAGAKAASDCGLPWTLLGLRDIYRAMNNALRNETAPALTPLSPEARAARMPRIPPAVLANALQDSVHVESGVTRPAKAHREAPAESDESGAQPCAGKWSERPGAYAGATFYCEKHPKVTHNEFCPLAAAPAESGPTPRERRNPCGRCQEHGGLCPYRDDDKCKLFKVYRGVERRLSRPDAVLVKKQVGAAQSTPQSDANDALIAQLMKFYAVDNLRDLVKIQSEHIEKLQKKLPPLLDQQIRIPREG